MTSTYLQSQLSEALNNPRSKLFVPVQSLLSLVVFISILSIILETVQSPDGNSFIFIAIEWYAAIFFAFEYCARIIASKKKLGYIFSFWGFIDLISILPTFLSISNLTVFKSLRTLRVLRLLRIIRMAKISRAYLKTHSKIKSQAEFVHLNIAIYFFALISATIGLGSVLYVTESSQKAYSNIPLAMLQVSKVFVGGIGVEPASTLVGQIVMVFTGFLGLALFGLLISIVSGIVKEWLLGSRK